MTRWKADTVRTLIYCVVLVSFKLKVDTGIWYLFLVLFVFPFHCAAEIIVKGSLFGKLVFLSPTELKLGETYKIQLTHNTKEPDFITTTPVDSLTACAATFVLFRCISIDKWQHISSFL